MPANSILVLRAIHTGLLPDGRPNLSSVLIDDADFGFEQQHRKTAVYVPVGGFIDLALTSRTLFSLTDGNIAGHVRTGVLRVDMFIRLRNPADLGGPLGVGVPLSGAILNFRRVGGVLQMVIDTATAQGFILGERLTVAGLVGPLRPLNATYTLSAVAKGENFAGVSAVHYLLSMPSAGPDIAAVTLAGVTLTLPDGKVRIELSGSGNAGGISAESALYVGGDANVLGMIDPTVQQMTPVAAAAVPPTSFFVQDIDGVPYFKDSASVLHSMVGGGGGGGGGNDVVYRPGGMAGGNVYTTWPTAYAAALTVLPARIIVDSSLVSPAPLDAGAWDMAGITLAGTFDIITLDILEIQDGAILTNLFYVTNLLQITSVSSLPAIVPLPFIAFILDYGAQLLGTGPASIIDFSASSGFILQFLGTQINGPNAISVSAGNTVSIALYASATLGNDSITGTGDLNISIRDATAGIGDSQAGLTGSISVNLDVSSARIGYGGGSFLTSSDVQSAITELARLSGVPVFMFQPGGVAFGNVYTDWTTMMVVVAQVLPNRPMIVFDDTFAPCLVPLGTWDLAGVTLAGRSKLLFGGPATTSVTLANGCVFLSLERVTGYLSLVSASTVPIFSCVGTQNYLVIDEGSSLQATGTYSFLSVASATLTVELREGSKFLTGISPVLQNDPAGGTIILIINDGAVVEADTLGGTTGGAWTVVFRSPAHQFSGTQTGLTDILVRRYEYQLGEGSGANGYLFDDFHSTVVASSLQWSATANGAGSGVFVDVTLATAENPGIRRLDTGTTAAGRGLLRQNSSMAYLSTKGESFVEWVVRIPTLSTVGVQDYFVNVGWNNNTAGTQGTNAIAFRYDDGNWIAYARSGAAVDTATIDTGIAPVAGAWTKLRIETTPQGAFFYIGTSPGTLSLVATMLPAVLPTTLGLFAPMAIIQKQVGLLSRTMFVDYCHFGYTLYTSR
jgi:hypothetical protein